MNSPSMVKKTFDIDLKTDQTDYFQAAIARKREEIIDTARKSAERDPFLDVIKKLHASMLDHDLKVKYGKFIAKHEAKYKDWSDCVIEEPDSTFYCNDYVYYYYKDLADSDAWFDPYGDDVYDNFPGALFVNPDAYYVNQKGGYFVDQNGNRHASPYFRYIEIDEYKQLDPRLLVVYADYFLQKYGFADWFLQLDDDQVCFLRNNLEELNITKNQRYIISGNPGFGLWNIDEKGLREIRLIEQSADLAQKTISKFKLQPFIGFFMKKLSPSDFNHISVAKLDQETFDYLIDHFWEYFSQFQAQCQLRIFVEFLLDDANFSDNKLTSVKLPKHIAELHWSDWDVAEVIELAGELSSQSDKVMDRIQIVREFLSFKEWYEQKRISNYRDADSRGRNSLDLARAYQTVKNPLNPQLCIENTWLNQAKIV